MAKRRKRPIVKKKKEEDEDNDDEIEEPSTKKVAVSSTSLLEEEIHSEPIGTEVGFSSHFWCNYCEFSSDTKKELITHMREHMVKCSYCAFSSLSKADIAKHVKIEHAEEAEKSVCEVDSSSSSTEHDMDKDPCSACIFCDFMTYSTEHLEKHTKSKHQGMLPKSVAKMISKQISARVRRDDALFYFAISSESFDSSFTPVDTKNSGTLSDLGGGDKSPILIEPDKCKRDVKIERDSMTSPQNVPEMKRADLKPNATTLLSEALISEQKSTSSDNVKESSKMIDWKVKVETLYCLSCPYSNVAIEKLKCHALAQHPQGIAACSFNSEGACRFQDVNFFCIRENCSYTNVQNSEYEEHIIACCSKESLSVIEKERLKATIDFIFKFHEKDNIKFSQTFLEFSSHYRNNSETDRCSVSPTDSNPPGMQHLAGLQEPAAINPNHQQGDRGSNLMMSNMQSTTVTDNQQSMSSMPFKNLVNANNETVVSSFQTPVSSSLNSLHQNQVVYGQQELNSSFSNNVDMLEQSAEMNIQSSSPSFSSNKDMQSSDGNYTGQTLPLWNEQTPQFGNCNTNSSFHPNSNALPQSVNSGVHIQDPSISASFNFNTSTVTSNQQSTFSQNMSNQLSQPQLIPENASNTSFPSYPVNLCQNNPPFSGHTNDQLQHPHQVQDLSQAQGPQSMNTSGPEDSMPKMLDLLTPSTVLLDDDLDIQPWPSTLAQAASPSTHLNSQSFGLATQPSLSTNPLPQTQFSSQQNQPDFSASSDAYPHNVAFTSHQTLAVPQSYSDALPYQSQSQVPVHNSNPQGFSNPGLDMNNQLESTAMSAIPFHGQNDLQYSHPISETIPHNEGDYNAARSSHVFPNTVQNPEHSNYAGPPTGVPNFLVPSSNVSIESASNQQQGISFLNSPAPHHSTASNPLLPPEQPLTPLKSPAMGQPKLPNSNSPLSPSIYLNGKPPRQQQSPAMPQGFTPPHPRMQGPHLMNPGLRHSHPHVRQQLFMQNRGRPRGPRGRMMRPPVNPVDDDVIVTAVVRGPSPQRHPAPMQHRGRGGPPNMRGRGGPPTVRGMRGPLIPRGRGAVHRGRGRPPITNQAQGRGPIDVSRHFVDLACVVNPNEEMGDEADEIQIVGVTPGKGGSGPPKAVDAKKFSYCCIHCGEDQGSKQIMKRHIKVSHSDSLLGAFRNLETGQWLFFCPQLSCEFMTYDENRLTDHLYSCYSYDKNKQLPFDMQSALRNLKSLKIRQVNVHASAQPNSLDDDGQGLRDAFNNNLKDAFDDMVENTLTRHVSRPNQPPNPPPPVNQPPAHFAHRGALRGPYQPRPARGLRQRLPRPGEMPPSFRHRNPMMGGSPRQPPGFRGRPRNPAQFPGQRGAPPIRNNFAPRGQRAPNRGFMARPCLPGMPGNEQTPIVIDLDADSPENTNPRGQTGFQVSSVPIPAPPNVMNAEAETPVLNQLLNTNQTIPSLVNDNNPMNPRHAVGADGFNHSNFHIQGQTPGVASHENPNSSLPIPPHNLNIITTLPHTRGPSLPQSEIGANPLPGNQQSAPPSHSDTAPIPLSTQTTTSNDLPGNTNLMPSNESSYNIPTSSSANGTESQTVAPRPEQVLSTTLTSVRNIPSPSELMAEVNALSNPSTSSTNNPPQDSLRKEIPDETSGLDDEEQINTILLDKVFAKVPHMPKKLSQRLVLKFKKYAADRGVIITPTSKVIDEFVSKISYKGSHSAPTGVQGQDVCPTSDPNLPSQAPATTPLLPVVPVPCNAEAPESGQQPVPRVPLVPKAADSDANPGPLPPHSSSPNDNVQQAQSQSRPPPLPAQPQSSEEPMAAVGEMTNADVTETKVILPKRNLQFSGTFANIIKTKSELVEKNSSAVMEGDDRFTEDVDSEKSSGPSYSALLSQPESQRTSEDRNLSGLDLDGLGLPLGQQLAAKSNEMLGKNVKSEMPFSFPSSSKDDSIEVQSSVDHLICGHASLEVDIAGKPLSSSDLSDKLMDSPVDMKGSNTMTKENDYMSIPSVDSSGKLLLKVKKNNKPRMPMSHSKSKEDEITPHENEAHLSVEEDLCIRRSERKRKVVKIAYEPEEMDEMDQLISDEDDDYHIESDESYDGSDLDSRGRKKVKKCNSPPDPTAFDLSIKGFYGCWVCRKSFSRVLFVKRHIMKKHANSGFCAILFSDNIDTETPPDQSSLLLFCPQNCCYVTSDHDAFIPHLENCGKSPLDTGESDHRIIQKEFISSELPELVEGIALGVISTKVPKKGSAPRRKSVSKTKAAASHTAADGGDVIPQHQDSNTVVVTAAVVHHQPPNATATFANTTTTMPEPESSRGGNQTEMLACAVKGVVPPVVIESGIADQHFWDPNLASYEGEEEEEEGYAVGENVNMYDQEYPC